MLYKSPDDFYGQISDLKRLTREEEKDYAQKMRDGDEEAKRILTESYLPTLGSYLKRYSRNPSLDMIYRGIAVLEAAIADFDFRSDNQSPNSAFVHVLSDRVRKMMVEYIAEGRSV